MPTISSWISLCETEVADELTIAFYLKKSDAQYLIISNRETPKVTNFKHVV